MSTKSARSIATLLFFCALFPPRETLAARGLLQSFALGVCAKTSCIRVEAERATHGSFGSMVLESVRVTLTSADGLSLREQVNGSDGLYDPHSQSVIVRGIQAGKKSACLVDLEKFVIRW